MSSPTINNLTSDAGVSTAFTFTGYTPTAGANAKLVVAVMMEGGGGNDVSSVTYDGNDLTVRIEADEDTGAQNLAEIWDIDDPLSLAASGDIVITPAANASLQMWVMTLLGVKSGAPETTDGQTEASSTSNATAVTPTSADTLILSGWSVGSDVALSATSPLVEVSADLGSGSARGGCGSYELASPSAQTPTWTVASADRTAQACAVYASAPGGLDRGVGRGIGRGIMKGVG